MSDNPQPLEDITVLDFTQIMAGPFCTMLLADMGADVIKIEKPSGDDIRGIGPPFINGESAAFLQINRNKRSIVMDLKHTDSYDVISRMISKADIIVQNFRPGVMENLNLDYDSVRKFNQSIIYCSISGFGTTGPYKKRPGFDLVTQGMSGIMSLTGEPGGDPTKTGVPITDLNAGFYAAYGILNAYIQRLKTGKGQLVDTSLLEGGLAYTFWESAIFFATGISPSPAGSAHRLTAPYQSFSTIDGHINIGAATQANWIRLCGAIDRPDLLNDKKFDTNTDRMEHLEELQANLNQTFRSKTTTEWLNILELAGVPCGPVYNIEQAYNDPQVLSRNMVVEIEHPIAGLIKNIGIPVKLHDTPGSIRRPAPTLGQHTDEILAQFGYTQEESRSHRAGGFVK
ncbi:MAG: CoA transferase [Chloroflexota bacterium]|nr:CoA transferase [Chloroflexota bacterium]